MIDISASEQHLKHKVKTFEKMGCSTDAISFADLFDHYHKADFLYFEKFKLIKPHLAIIKHNWEAALKAGKKILWIVTAKKPGTETLIGSLAIWRSTLNGWFPQHLTSVNSAGGINTPASTCAMMLLIQIEAILRVYQSGQNLFNPSKKYPTKVFKSIENTINPEYACVNEFNYLGVKPNSYQNHSKSVKIIKCSNSNRYEIYDFAAQIRGKVYAQAEELAEGDIELQELDDIYRQASLSRKRYIWMAFCSGRAEPAGAAIVYRGPFGFNFSLIENRCDFLINDRLDNDTAECVCKALLTNAATAYFDSYFPLEYPVDFIPVVTDKKTAAIVKRVGAFFNIRKYNQTIWLRPGFYPWYQHVEKIYQKVLQRAKRNQCNE